MMNFKPLEQICFLLLFSAIILGACKKPAKQAGETEPEDTVVIKPVGPDTIKTRMELTLDSIYLYAKQVYLWNDALPSYETFKPLGYKTYADPLLNFEKELFDISQYKINATTGKPYEYVESSSGGNAGYPKYSYISDLAEQNPVAFVPGKKSSVDLEGNGYDFGLKLVLAGSVSNYRVMVQAVYPGSDAAAKGVSRGDYFTVINGKTFGSNYSGEVSQLNSWLFDASTVSIQLIKKNSTSQTVTLTRKSYKSSPIYKDSVYVSGTKKIGYLAYARFSNTSNSKPEFDRIFSKFSSQGVTDLIVDLRYNGGGYVHMAEYLINCIAPSSLNGNVMFTEYYNSQMQQGKASILSRQPILDGNDKVQYQNGRIVTYADLDFSPASQVTRFSKVGSLNGVSSIVFIVTSATASASELVINSLKPHISNVKIIGETSYGKPVGFFPIRIDNYDVYFSMFQTKNSAGEGDYFAGFTPDKTTVDDLNYELGDLRENSVLNAYNYITRGSFSSTTVASTSSVSPKPLKVLQEGSVKFGDTEFKGMIENRHKIK